MHPALRADARNAASHPTGERSPADGPNLGWALACFGLLLAAGILGLHGEGRRTTARTRARLAGALRPLFARR